MINGLMVNAMKLCLFNNKMQIIQFWRKWSLAITLRNDSLRGPFDKSSTLSINQNLYERPKWWFFFHSAQCFLSSLLTYGRRYNFRIVSSSHVLRLYAAANNESFASNWMVSCFHFTVMDATISFSTGNIFGSSANYFEVFNKTWGTAGLKSSRAFRD